MRIRISLARKALVVLLVLPLIIAWAIDYTASPAQVAPADPFTGAASDAESRTIGIISADPPAGTPRAFRRASR